MRIPFGISVLAAEAWVPRFLPAAAKRALFVGITLPKHNLSYLLDVHVKTAPDTRVLLLFGFFR